MSFRYVRELLAEREHEKALRLAEQLIGQTDSSQELAALNYALCQARLGLGEPQAALPIGRLAAKLARDSGDYDLLAEVLLCKGQAYGQLRQYETSLTMLFEYFEHQAVYGRAHRLAGRIWYEIGQAYQGVGDAAQAAWAYQRGSEVAEAQGAQALAQRCRRGAISAHLELGAFEAAATLIVASGRYTRQHPEDLESLILYYQDKASYTQQLGRHQRSVDHALRALALAKEHLELQVNCHLLLSRSAKALGHLKDALGFALAARVAALDCRRFELEYEAAAAMFELIQAEGRGLLVELDDEYLANGIDLGRYVSPAALRRR